MEDYFDLSKISIGKNTVKFVVKITTRNLYTYPTSSDFATE